MMNENKQNDTMIIREKYDLMCRVMFLIGAAINIVIAGFAVTGIVDSSLSNLDRIGATVATFACIAAAYTLWCLDLELRINSERVTARAWPLRSTVVPIDQVLNTEVVQIDPMGDYGGWGLKGTKQDKLIGGGGTTALRITYLHESSEERKLTFLTDRANEAERRITTERTR